MPFVDALPKGIVQNMMASWFLTSTLESTYVSLIRITIFAMATLAFSPSFSDCLTGTEKNRLGDRKIFCPVLLNADPFYSHALLKVVSSFVSSPVKPVPFQKPSTLMHMRAFFAQLHRAYGQLSTTSPDTSDLFLYI